jgi:hypothetical protein
MVEVAKIYQPVAEGKSTPDEARFLLSCMNLPGILVDGYYRGEAGASRATAAE